MTRLSPVAALALAGLCSLGIGPASAASPADQPGLPPEGQGAMVALGDMAGAVSLHLPDTIRNPFEGQAAAIAEGQRLYNKMNCAGCHGFDGTGNMGPNLTDHFWRYGGTPISVFKSLYEGRPQGMPAWSAALTPPELWKITAFIQSLGGMYATRDFYDQQQGDNQGDLIAPEVAAEDMALGMALPPGSTAPAVPVGGK